MSKRLATAILGGVTLALMLCGTLLAAEDRRGPPDRPDGPPRADGPRHPDRPQPPHPPRPPHPPHPDQMQGHPPNPPDGHVGPHPPEHPDGPPRWPHHDWEAFEREDPEMFKLLKADRDMEREARELAIQYRRAPQKEREEIRDRIEELVEEHFEVRQKRRTLELERLEKELDRLRLAIEKRNDARDALVGKRISQLIGEDDIDF